MTGLIIQSNRLLLSRFRRSRRSLLPLMLVSSPILNWAQSARLLSMAGLQQSSGVAVSQECLAQFQELKLGKKIKYIIYTLNQNNTEIVVAKTSTSSSYDDFIAELPPAECRYAIYDFEYEKGDEGKRNKICFFTWSPDDAKIKQKMVFASSKDALRKALVGISSEIQGTDFSEVSYETVLEKVSRSTF